MISVEFILFRNRKVCESFKWIYKGREGEGVQLYEGREGEGYNCMKEERWEGVRLYEGRERGGSESRDHTPWKRGSMVHV